jgi:ribonuclease T2
VEPASTEPVQTESAGTTGGGGGGGKHHKRHRKHGTGGNPEGPANPEAKNVTGNFDFYLMSLSWSPGFCATPAGQNDPGQCAPGRKFSFVLHGLWPQYEQQGWPEDCSTEQMDPALVNQMLPMMPSPKLIQHEWQKHGTCSGLTSKEYFDEAGEAFHKFNVPAVYQNLSTPLNVNPAEIRSQLAAANPNIGEQAIVVQCAGGGRYLSEVHVCLTKDLAGRRCNRETQAAACRSDSVLMRPVR